MLVQMLSYGTVYDIEIVSMLVEPYLGKISVLKQYELFKLKNTVKDAWLSLIK